MEILLNGVAHPLQDASSVAELVASLNLTQQSIAVAVNRHVITRQNWANCLLQPGDQVDVVRAIGGG